MRWDARAVGGIVAVAAVLLSAVLAAAVGGSWELEDRSFELGGWNPRAGTPVEEGGAALEEVDPLPDVTSPPSTDTSFDWSWLGVVGRILLVLLAGVAVWWLWLRQRAAARPRRMRDEVATAAVVDEPELPVLRRGVAQAQRFLAETSGPTDAIIAAWLALEDAAAASGVPRTPSQTPTELTVTVLEHTNADPRATAELLSLYHHARFSSDPVGPDHLERAARCFGELAASWGQSAPRARMPRA